MRLPTATLKITLLSLTVLAGLSQSAEASCTPGLGSDGTATCIGTGALANNAEEGYEGLHNSAFGMSALLSNTTGSSNTAVGTNALVLNTNGTSNTAIGARTMSWNTSGEANTAVGVTALDANTTGSGNTAIGRAALEQNSTGSGNVAIGMYTLLGNASGNRNTATGNSSGPRSGDDNTVAGYMAGDGHSGNRNTLLGIQAGTSDTRSTSGSNNIALGYQAGSAWTTGSNNIAIGSNGVAADLNAIRIGTQGVQTRTFIAGIRGARVARRGASAVLIDATGQLGTVRSSIRYKENVQPMGDASSALLELRPVTFRYKEADLDGTKPIQYGLIAEDVEKVMPDLVVRNEDGSIETVAYHLLPSLLLSEYQKQNRELVETKARLETMEAELATLRLAVEFGLPPCRVRSLSAWGARPSPPGRPPCRPG